MRLISFQEALHMYTLYKITHETRWKTHDNAMQNKQCCDWSIDMSLSFQILKFKKLMWPMVDKIAKIKQSNQIEYLLWIHKK